MPDVLAESEERVACGPADRNCWTRFMPASIEALHTPEDDKVLRLVEHPPEHFAIPGSAGEALHAH